MLADRTASGTAGQGTILTWFFVMACALGLGLAVVAQPAAGIVATASTLGVLVLLRVRRHASGLFLSVLGVLLIGYAFLGRGFAYLGFPPLYVGELALAVGIVAVGVGGGIHTALRNPLSRLLLVFVLWGAFRTLPYLSVYGLDALRDGVVWGYAVFAILVAAAFMRAGAFDRLQRVLRSVYPLLLVWLPISLLLVSLQASWLPLMPGTDIPLIQSKPGDAAVHLAGAAAFLGLGARAASGNSRPMSSLGSWFCWAAWAAGLLVTASQTRGGFLAAAAGLLLVMLARPFSSWWKFVAAATFVIGLFLIVGSELDIGRVRRVSPQQIVANVQSVFGSSPREGLDGTRRWRLDWWGDIVQYTVFGEHFWLGKGFGVNLAVDDGYVVDPTNPRPLRSPHNGHMTILARTGVPGAIVWLGLQAAFAFALWGAYRRAVRRGHEHWAALNGWLLAYWAAFMINGAFDVFLEGPQGGIWFWSVFGMGIAALEVQRNAGASDEHPAPDRRPW